MRKVKYTISKDVGYRCRPQNKVAPYNYNSVEFKRIKFKTNKII